MSDFVRGVVSVLLKNGVLHNEPCEIRQNLIWRKCCTCHYVLNQCFNCVLGKKVSVCCALFWMYTKDRGSSSLSRRALSWFCWSIRGLSESVSQFSGSQRAFQLLVLLGPCWWGPRRRWFQEQPSGVTIAPRSRYVSRGTVSLHGQAVLSFTE